MSCVISKYFNLKPYKLPIGNDILPNVFNYFIREIPTLSYIGAFPLGHYWEYSLPQEGKVCSVPLESVLRA